MANASHLFEMCIKRTRESPGRLTISCRLGQWSVSGPDAVAILEAFHYWRQYFDDGTYHDLLCAPLAPPEGA